VYMYGRDLRSFVAFLGGRPLVTATSQEMRTWLVRPRKKVPHGAVAPSTIKREVMELRSLYRFLVEQANVMSDSPALKLEYPKVPNDDPRPVAEHLWIVNAGRRLTPFQRLNTDPPAGVTVTACR
jgi:site-specific recombinase XerD